MFTRQVPRLVSGVDLLTTERHVAAALVESLVRVYSGLPVSGMMAWKVAIRHHATLSFNCLFPGQKMSVEFRYDTDLAFPAQRPPSRGQRLSLPKLHLDLPNSHCGCGHVQQVPVRRLRAGRGHAERIRPEDLHFLPLKIHL